MPEDMESPTEKLEEHIHEAAEHNKENWLRWCALMAAVFSVMAALSGLISSGYANKAMMEQIRASDQWGYYQAKSIKAMITESQGAILKGLPESEPAEGTDTPKPDVKVDMIADTLQADKLKQYKEEGEKIRAEAESLTQASEAHMQQHEITARAVTCFQVAIAMIAIVVLTKRRRFMAVSAVLGIAGFIFLLMGV